MCTAEKSRTDPVGRFARLDVALYDWRSATKCIAANRSRRMSRMLRTVSWDLELHRGTCLSLLTLCAAQIIYKETSQHFLTFEQI